MRETNKIKLKDIVIIIILITGIILAFKFYKKNNFNGFYKAERVLYTSEFERDNKTTYSQEYSYKINSENLNDAMLCKEFNVNPNSAYKLTCMVKTEDIVVEKEGSDAGAYLSIYDSTEKSKSLTGTNDWTKLELYFTSKNKDKITVGFRLGGYDDTCKGTAWFSDIKLEETPRKQDTNWNFACFIIENTEVIIDNKEVKLSLSTTDIADMRNNMSRFKNSCEELSDNNMNVDYDIINITEPLTSLAYDEKNGYYVSPGNAKELIQSYINKEEYDHIFVCVRLGDESHLNDIQINDWIGLGGMDYLGIGFSNIRLPNSDKSYTYKYNASVNTFPEEVFIHEFLHSLERTAIEHGYNTPALHDYANYGYEDEKLVGQKVWYGDYMKCNIDDNDTKVGLNQDVYTLKPIHASMFKYSVENEEVFKEPENIIEEIRNIFGNIANLFKSIKLETEMGN